MNVKELIDLLRDFPDEMEVRLYNAEYGLYSEPLDMVDLVTINMHSLNPTEVVGLR